MTKMQLFVKKKFNRPDGFKTRCNDTSTRLKSAIRKWGDCEPSQIGLKSNRDPLVSGNTEIFHLSADYRERSDKIATMSVNPKSTQQPVTSREASVRVVGFARNVLSLFI